MKKSLFLISILIFILSCTKLPVKRDIASSYENHKIWEYSANWIVLHTVQLTKQQLLEDPKQLYQLMGAIDAGEKSFPFTLESGEEVNLNIGVFKGTMRGLLPYRKLFKRSADFHQMPYSEWIENFLIIKKSLEMGLSSFKNNGIMYSLWGTELREAAFSKTIQNLVSYFSKAYGLDKTKIYKMIVDGHKYYHVKEKGLFILPGMVQVPVQQIMYTYEEVLKEFPEQNRLEEGEIYEWFQAYGNKRDYYEWNNNLKLTLGRSPNEEYFSKKREAFLRNEKLEDNYCELRIHNDQLNRLNNTSELFKGSLETHKISLMRETGLTNNQYNEIAAVAMGILEVESKAGSSLKYTIKERLRLGDINIGQMYVDYKKKKAGRDDDNSRGLTQIKSVSDLVEGTIFDYIEGDDLSNPEEAAIVTILALKEKYKYLKHFQKRHHNIDSWNWAKYIYYFYSGRSHQITKGEATPAINAKIKIINKIIENLYFIERC